MKMSPAFPRRSMAVLVAVAASVVLPGNRIEGSSALPDRASAERTAPAAPPVLAQGRGCIPTAQGWRCF